MGMSASQARLLALTERMNDIEYQGQQINQQRTTLSNQINALYNTLLAMDVPTPPSTNDYQKVVYSGKLGATEYTFSADDVIPKGNDTYSIKVGQKGHGNTIEATTGFATVGNGTGTIKGKITTGKTTEFLGGEAGLVTTNTGKDSGVRVGNAIVNSDAMANNYNKSVLYTDGSGKFYQCEGSACFKWTSDANGNRTYSIDPKYSKYQFYTMGDSSGTPLYCQPATDSSGNSTNVIKDIGSIYVQDENGNVRQAKPTDFDGKDADGNYILKSDLTYIDTSAGDTEFSLSGAQGRTVDGKAVYTFDSLAAAGIDQETINAYKEAVANSDLQDDKGKNYTWEDFYVVLSADGTASFVLKSDLDDGNDNCSAYAYSANGEYTTKQTFENCKLQFDPANGRITNIGIPNYDVFGNVTGYTNIRMESSLEQDEEAYQDAMADYNYNKALYDKQQEEINKKTELIQQEDKNLELKLTRLDNERNAVNTEIEAVKKVIQDSIDKGFKTFSG